jgi:hypothetical protein
VRKMTDDEIRATFPKLKPDPARDAARAQLQQWAEARARACAYLRRFESLPDATSNRPPIPMDVFDQAEGIALALREILDRIERARRRCEATRDPTAAAQLGAALSRLPDLAETADRALEGIIEQPERAASALDLRALRDDVETAAAMLRPATGPRAAPPSRRRPAVKPLTGRWKLAADFIREVYARENRPAEGKEIADAAGLNFDGFRKRVAEKLSPHGFIMPGRGGGGYLPPPAV